MTFEQAKAILDGLLADDLQADGKPEMLIEPVIAWLHEGISTSEGICDNAATHQRDLARLIVLSNAALLVVHKLPRMNGFQNLREGCMGIALFCIDRVIWCSNAEDCSLEQVATLV